MLRKKYIKDIMNNFKSSIFFTRVKKVIKFTW